MSRDNKAFTLAELILVVFLLGIMAFVAVPRLQFATLRRMQADTVAGGLAADLRLARALAVDHSATNVVGFGLSMTGAEPYSGYDIINLDTDEIIESYTIAPEIQCTGGSDFRFGPLGNLLSGSDNQIVVSAEGRSFTINVISGTGTVQCVED
jgi:type II secretory pathway pseudopilin PulG